MTSRIRIFWLKDWHRFVGATGTGVVAGIAVWAWQSSAAQQADGTVPGLTGALVGWIAFVIVHALWVWLSVRGLDAAQTRRHARREDPSRVVRETLHVVAAIASVAGMGAMLLAAGSDPMGRVVNAGLGLATVLGAWAVIQLMYMLRYAAIYYEDVSGSRVPPIDFNTDDEDPTYLDFAYFSFTIGASFATSDANVRTAQVRAAVLGHSLLSFFFGSVVLASATSLMLQLVSVS